MNRYDPKLTDQLRQWLDDPAADPAAGAQLLFRLRANHAEFRRLSAAPETYRQYITIHLRKFLEFRTAGITHNQVVAKVDEARNIADAAEAIQKRSGKRPDHDTLPDEIRQCYVDNLDLLRKIADRHTKIRLILQTQAACKDADLYPFAKEIIELDKRRLANWKKYDTYSADITGGQTPQTD